MKPATIFPFFHPTSIVVIDDDPDFLESFEFRFGDRWRIQTFSDPDRAISYLRKSELERNCLCRLLSTTGVSGEEVGLHRDNSLIGYRQSEIASMMREGERFDQISVVLVDYDMPSMTGLDVCKELDDLPMRKLLLTGKASQDIAVNAFNAALIDGFLKKQADELSSQLTEQVARLQNEYFAGTTAVIGKVHALSSATYLNDPVFRIMLNRLFAQLDVVEYYAINFPCGLWLGTKDSQSRFVRVLSREEQNAHHEIAMLQSAPMELVNALDEGAIVPCFPTESGYYEEALAASWRDYVHPATFLNGRESWRYAVIDADRIQAKFGDVVSYADYLNRAKH